MREAFRRFAHRTSVAVGSPSAFLVAVATIAVWGASGPVFHFSDTWQLVINTGTTIVTFLMVFLIQNTQNRDAQVLHLKLDEVLRATRDARTELVDMEDMSDDDLQALQQQFRQLHEQLARRGIAPAPAGPLDPPDRGDAAAAPRTDTARP